MFIFIVYLTILGALLWLVDVALLCVQPRLLVAYLKITWLGFKRSPYEAKRFERVLIAKSHQLSKTELIYGYTPLVTALVILSKTKLGRASRLCDLGSGRGRVLLAARFLGAEATGVELDRRHCELAIRALVGTQAIIRNEDAKEVPLESFTHVYLAWTTWSWFTRREIKEQLAKLPLGAFVISVTWPLEMEEFAERYQNTLLFSWGFSPIWIYERVLRGD